MMGEPQWTLHNVGPTVFCESFRQQGHKWWIVSDPCQQGSVTATELTMCSGGSCVVPISMLSVGCVVCCNDPAVSQFSVDSVASCTPIRGKEIEI